MRSNFRCTDRRSDCCILYPHSLQNFLLTQKPSWGFFTVLAPSALPGLRRWKTISLIFCMLKIVICDRSKRAKDAVGRCRQKHQKASVSTWSADFRELFIKVTTQIRCSDVERRWMTATEQFVDISGRGY